MGETQAEPALGETADDGTREDVVISPEEAVVLAIDLHRKGAREPAEKIYREVLKHEPDNAVVLQYLGVLTHQDGDNEEALRFLRRSLEIDPADAGAWLNYGNVFVEAGHAREAIAPYRRAAELAPANADPYNNLGVVLRALGSSELAEEALRKAIAIAPDDPRPWHNLGNLLLAGGQVDEAIQCGLKALTLAPKGRIERKLLGAAYIHLGDFEKAREVYRTWLEDEPGNPLAAHYLAALNGEAPERASDAYVEATFDSFASSFDAKLQHLGYRAPQIVADALAAARPGETGLAVLDAGCGTGLCGPLLRATSATLVGLDLSRKMLARAKARKVYDELLKGELTDYLASGGARFDAIVSADALCYFGRLEAFAAGAASALRPGGVLVATFEAALDSIDVQLNANGRYAHGAPYLRQVFGDVGLTILAMDAEVLRSEQNRPVDGWVVTARRG